ncbi:MAG: hypothetical protein RIR00_1565 [Pseudomonadota bacterium]|jgi:hypothetical protein
MARLPHFIDDPDIQNLLDRATQTCLATLQNGLHEVSESDLATWRPHLQQHLSQLLCGNPAATTAPPLPPVPALIHRLEDLGQPFDLHSLPLPRPAQGYAVQRLDTDTLLDRHQLQFLTVRDPQLDALFPSHREAAEAARQWLLREQRTTDDEHLAIVPAAHDPEFRRHVLIFGVLTSQP